MYVEKTGLSNTALGKADPATYSNKSMIDKDMRNKLTVMIAVKKIVGLWKRLVSLSGEVQVSVDKKYSKEETGLSNFHFGKAYAATCNNKSVIDKHMYNKSIEMIAVKKSLAFGKDESVFQ